MSAGLYADPAVYDILHTPGTAAELDALERVERWWTGLRGRAPRRDRLWFEPACGSGRLLRTAAGRGRRVRGYDRDPGMVAYAAGRLGGRVVTADMTDAAVPGTAPGRVDLVFNTLNTLRLLPDDRAVLAHLDQVARLLRPGGLCVVGISLTDYGRLEHEEDLWSSVRGRCRVDQLVNYLPPEPGTGRARVETVISHLAITRPGGVEHRDDRYDLRCYDRRQWRRLLAGSPLRLAASFDARGHESDFSALPYQLEALVPAD